MQLEVSLVVIHEDPLDWLEQKFSQKYLWIAHEENPFVKNSQI